MSNTRKVPLAPLACAFLFGTTLLLYWPVHRFDFINYDDPLYVTENRHVQAGLSAAGAEWAFTTGAASNWHPVTWLSHMTDAQFFGLDPGRHHLTNAFLHALNAALLFLVCRGMTKADWPGFFVAALFAWHPLRVESVAWVSERKDVLSTLFFLMTLFLYTLYAEEKRPGAGLATGNLSRRKGDRPALLYAGALMLFALGLMSKPMLVTLPFVLLLLDYWPLKRAALFAGQYSDPGGPAAASWVRLIAEKIPFFALSLASCVATYMVQARGGAVTSLAKLSAGARLANAVAAYATYLKTAIWPTGLAVFYPRPLTWPADTVLGCAALLAGISGLVLWQARRQPYLLVGWLWYLGTLVPVIGLVQAGDQARADRYTYLPMMGIAIAVVWGGKALAGRTPALRLAMVICSGAALVAMLVATRDQLQYWRDSESLFRHALAVTRGNYVAHISLGRLRMNAKKPDEAKEEYLQALAIVPQDCGAHINLGRALVASGSLDEGIAELETATRLNPRMMLAHYNLGIALGEKERYQEAAEAYQRALSLEPDFASAHYNLGLSLARLGRLADAESEYRDAVRLDPDLAYAHYSLALVLRQAGHPVEAVEHLRRAAGLNPAYLPARQELGRTLVNLGQWEAAAAVYEELLRVQANDTVAQNNLGLALANLGKLSEAILHFTEVVRLDPGNFGARCNLAGAFMARGDYPSAATNYSAALRLRPGDTNVLAKLAFCESHGPSSEKDKSP